MLRLLEIPLWIVRLILTLAVALFIPAMRSTVLRQTGHLFEISPFRSAGFSAKIGRHECGKFYFPNQKFMFKSRFFHLYRFGI